MDIETAIARAAEKSDLRELVRLAAKYGVSIVRKE